MGFSPSDPGLELSRLHWPVTALGYGKRVGIWFQGCSIRCPGCCSDDTWALGQTATPVSQIMDWIRQLPSEDIQGFTISGGEPFDQPEALSILIDQLRNEFCAELARDILVYSGYPWSILGRRHSEILRKVDVVVSEP
ncbi:MAG: 4Fe-4S cluster-binding domain-containing protein, partial [Burkholderiaceae bacterium]|nr:4Fe-4S cluster-binding domain-containing protein [Burkholderiaceae bacterium]